MVISGPSLRILVTATQTPSAAATIGIIQTTESRVRLGESPLDCGTVGSVVRSSAILNSLFACRVPYQTGIERLDRQHGQHHYHREEKQPGPWLDRHERLELHQSRGEGVDENIHHRPPPDELDGSKEPNALLVIPDRTALHGDEQIRHHDDLRAWDDDACDQ